MVTSERFRGIVDKIFAVEMWNQEEGKKER
jgi:hypothetical protein